MVTGLLQLKKYYQQMGTPELLRECSEIQHEIAGNATDKKLETAHSFIQFEIGLRLIRNCDPWLRNSSQQLSTDEFLIRFGEEPCITIGIQPVDSNVLNVKERLLYLASIVSIFHRNGKSSLDSNSVKKWMSAVIGFDTNWLNAVVMKPHSMAELLPDRSMRIWLSPFIIRDAILLSATDAPYPWHLLTIKNAAKEMGYLPPDVENILEFIEQSGWTS